MSCLMWHHAVSTRRYPQSAALQQFVPDRTLQSTGCNLIHSLRHKTQETTNKRNMSSKQCRKTATKCTRSSLTSGCAFKSSKKDLKKSERSTCLGATHSVSMSAPAAKPHTLSYTQHIATYSRLLKIMWHINLLTRQQKCAKSNITQAANSNNNSNVVH